MVVLMILTTLWMALPWLAFLAAVGILFKKATSKPDVESIIDALSNRVADENLYVLNQANNYVFVNDFHIQFMQHTFGFKPKPGLNILDILPEPYKSRHKDIYDKAHTNERFMHLEKVGNRFLKFSTFRYIAPEEQIMILVSIKDETENTLINQELEKYREELEKMVKERSQSIINQRNFYQKLIDEDPNYLFVRNAQGKYIMANEAAASSYNTTVNEAIGKSVITLHSNKSEALGFISEDAEILKTGKEKHSLEQHQWRDGTLRWSYMKKKRIEIDDEYYVLGVMTDVSSLKETQNELEKKNEELKNALEELKEMQVKLVSSEKMASIGQLTGGFAHEINNPINYVGGNIAPLKRDIREVFEWIERKMPNTVDSDETLVETKEEIFQLLHGIDEGASRIKKLIKDLKNLSQSGGDEPVITDINQVLNSTLNMIIPGLSDQIKIKKNIGEVSPVMAVNRELQQVFLNIMDYLAQQEEKNTDILIATQQDGDFNKISFSVPGMHLPVQEIVEMFDPFSRTDRDGTKLSLGLAICYRLVTKMNGQLFVDSEFTKGTQFVIKLPVIAE